MVRLRGPKNVIKSAKLHPAEAEKLERSGRNAREAIEYHNMVTLTPIGSLEIDIHFLKKEYEDVKYYLIALEKKIEDKQKKLDEIKGVPMEETPADKLDELAAIKSKEELLGDIITLLQSPARNVISALQNAAPGKVGGLVKALEERK